MSLHGLFSDMICWDIVADAVAILQLLCFCRQLKVHHSRWSCLKLMSDTRKSWMQTKWPDLQPSKASHQMQSIVTAESQCFAEGLPEVVLQLCFVLALPFS